MRSVTVDLSPRMNLEVTVERREHAPTKRGQAVVAGSIELRHPSYVEKFVLQCSGADQQHTWLRARPIAGASVERASKKRARQHTA